MGKYPKAQQFTGGGAPRRFGGDDRRRFDGPRDNHSRGGFDARRDGDRPLFSTQCSSCGKSCEVPFRPTGERPVYCTECFRSQRDSGGAPAPARGAHSHEHRERSFMPTRDARPAQHADTHSARFDLLERKLDRIIGLLERSASPAAVVNTATPTAPAPTVATAPTNIAAKKPRPTPVAKKTVDTKALNTVLKQTLQKSAPIKTSAAKVAVGKLSTAKTTVKKASATKSTKKK